MSVSFENKETNHGVLTFTISQEQIKPAWTVCLSLLRKP